MSSQQQHLIYVPQAFCLLQTALDRGSTHAVKSSVGSKAEEAGRNVVTQGIIRRFSFKSDNDEGGDFKLQTVVRGSCGQGMPLWKGGAGRLLLAAAFCKV